MSGEHADGTRSGPPWPDAERERREQLWIQREAERLRRTATARLMSKEEPQSASPSPQTLQPVKGQATDQSVPTLLPGRSTTDASRHVRRGPRLTPEERERREEEWIRHDVELHVPKNMRPRSCSPPNPTVATKPLAAAANVAEQASQPTANRKEVPDAMMKEAKALPQKGAKATISQTGSPGAARPHQPSKSSTASVTSMAALEAAALEAGLPADAPAEVKRKLRSEIPEEVIDRELPWILRDIAVGRRLSSKVS